MRISRLFVAAPLATDTLIKLDDDAGHYLKTVLRLKKNAELMLFNGSGREYSGRLREVSRQQVLVEILSVTETQMESSLSINFGLAVSRSERMDFAIQKAVELGVNRIEPLITEHCVVHLKGEKVQKKARHWQKIAIHAAEQSGRCRVPDITPAQHLTDWVDQPQGLKVFLDPRASQTLRQLPPEQKTVTVLSGPEGGFSEPERQLAEEYGFQGIRLGPRILRTETAALAAISAIQTLWGDFY